jgi:alpha-galactosidase
VAASSALWTDEMVHATQQNQEYFISRYVEEKIKINFWWMDAGWYVNNGSWVNTGTWEVDKKRFPNGLRAVSDYAHARGIKTIVWVEPERVTRGTWLWNEHPDWLLRTPEEEKQGQALLNLGNPAAVKWLVNHMSKLITQQGIDVYRTDFNIEPLQFWRDHDTPDREGITEIKYVEGFLHYLDELHRLHPNVLFDTCASGGRRNDLETLRRAVPMHRSDYTYEPVGIQNAGYGIAFWIPYYGTPVVAHDNYDFRSAWGPQINLAWDMRRKDTNYNHLRHMLAQWREVSKDFFGDYYPLTHYNPTQRAWMAWQFNRPSLGEGMVQAFRRVQSSCESMRFRLHGLEPDGNYDVRNLDQAGVTQMTGRDLMGKGVQVVLKDQPDSAVLVYKLVRESK